MVAPPNRKIERHYSHLTADLVLPNQEVAVPKENLAAPTASLLDKKAIYES